MGVPSSRLTTISTKISIVALDASLQPQGDLVVRDGSMNSIAYDPTLGVIYVAESSIDAVSAVSLDGTIKTVAALRAAGAHSAGCPGGNRRRSAHGGFTGGAVFGAVVGLLRLDPVVHAGRCENRARQPDDGRNQRCDHRADDGG